MQNMRFRLWTGWGLVGLAFLAGPSAVRAQGQSKTVVVHATKRAFSPPLSQIVPTPPSASSSLANETDLLLVQAPRMATMAADPVLQGANSSSTPGLAASTSSGLNLLGVGTGFPNYKIQASAPDSNGAVGPTQYVQWVNSSFAVFNKSDGSIAYGPAAGNTLWQNLGGSCSTFNNLDPIVQFDKLANRWVMMMPIFASPPFLCVAVSTTSDVINTGWNLYAFPVPGRQMPDYPKMGVWPDGYYVTYNQGRNLIFVGAAVCALDRNSMLNGAAATMQCFTNLSTTAGSLLPGDLDGTTPPPANSPDYFLTFDGNEQSLNLWQFHVDWNTPSNTTFTGPTNIPVAAFTEACGETNVQLNYTTGACIPQLGTSQTLDSYADRVMYRLPYRNFGDHQSLLVNHTVNTGTGGNITGIRWYELQNNGGGFGLFQQGTYAPDASYRWMGSIAMDKMGDIAMGYSVSSSTMNPSVRYTGRVPTDPLGQMGGETDVLSAGGVAHGSQTTSFHWGDYSSLAIDSTDDCTFWYTNEYQPTNGGHWSTRLASFSFRSCSGAPPPPWAIVNKASRSGPMTNLTIPPTGSNNLIAVVVMFNGTTSVTGISDNVGNTYVSAGARASVASLSVETWYAVNSNPGATVITPTFAGSPTHVEITEWEVSGIAASAPDAANSVFGSILSNNIVGPAVTTSQSGDFIVSALFSGAGNLTGISGGNEFTEDFGTNGNGWAHITSTSATAGGHQASWLTSTAAGKYCATAVAFLAAH